MDVNTARTLAENARREKARQYLERERQKEAAELQAARLCFEQNREQIEQRIEQAALNGGDEVFVRVGPHYRLPDVLAEYFGPRGFHVIDCSPSYLGNGAKIRWSVS